MVPAGEPAGAIDATGATGRGGGALYTGRGPVWGTIMRGAGACGAPTTAGGAAGRGGAAGVAGAVDIEVTGADGGATTAAGGGVGRGGMTGAAEAEIAGAV
jgi:pilus assembly protein FimV